MDTDDSFACALLELFERFHMARVGDSCLQSIQEVGENTNLVVQYLGGCSAAFFWEDTAFKLAVCK